MNPFSRIGSFANSLLKALENLNDAVRAADKRHWNESDRNQPVPVEVRLQEDLQRQRDTEQRQQTTIQKVIATGTVVAAIGAWFYAGIAYKQWKDTGKQMRIDERAWVQYRTERDQKIEVSANAPVTFHLLVKNIGKTVARHLDGSIFVEKLDITESPNFEREAGTGSEIRAGVLFPNDVWPNQIVEWVKVDPVTRTASPVIPTEEDAADWKADKFYFAVYGTLAYSDIFGFRHRTGFCMTFIDHPLPPEKRGLPTRRCIEKMNEVDNSDEENGPTNDWTPTP